MRRALLRVVPVSVRGPPRGCLRTLRVRLRRIFPPKASLSSAHFNGTRARNAPPRIAPAPLRNREIAFGGGRFPVRCISHRCVPLKGAVGRAVGTGTRRFSARLHSATANPPSSERGNPSAATARLAWSRCLPAPIASVPAASCPSRRRIRSGPVAGTPRPLRAIGTCPFLRGAFRAP